jgi:hypothetical protein
LSTTRSIAIVLPPTLFGQSKPLMGLLPELPLGGPVVGVLELFSLTPPL